MATSNKIFSLFSFIGFVLCCLPIPRYMQAWNIGTGLNMVWTGLACLDFFINSIIWNDNSNNSAPVWCDISSRLELAFVIAIPVAVLCMSRRVYLLITGNIPTTTAEKRHAVIFDLAICLGIPPINVALMYIPQDHRFSILEDFGCSSSVGITSVSLLLGGVPQVLVSFGCAVYSILTLRSLYKQSSQINKLLDNKTTIDRGKYLRVVVIAVIGSICLVPLGLYSLTTRWINADPWPGLKETHAEIFEVDQIPASIWRAHQNSQYTVEIFRWEFVFSAFILFSCFGIHKEARLSYLSAARHLFQYVPCLRVNKTSSHHHTESASKTLPPLVFARGPSSRKLKFLDFSPNKTRVIVDISGALPITQGSFSSMSVSSEGKLEP